MDEITSAGTLAKTCQFCWYELMTTDAPAAEAFYRHVIGWRMQDAGMPDLRYTLLMVGDTAVAGLMAMPPAACVPGWRPGWIGHIAVDDVDAMASRVQKAGGSVHRPGTDIPGIGRFAVLSDPQGAIFFLFHGTGVPPVRPAIGTPGTVGWHELYAEDGAKAFEFYSKLFGWTKADAIDMGPMGTYQLFSAGAEPIGGMMTKMPGGPGPMWNYYFFVDEINAALSRAKEKGAQVLNGPTQVPGGSWIAQCLDPQGAMFSMVSCSSSQSARS